MQPSSVNAAARVQNQVALAQYFVYLEGGKCASHNVLRTTTTGYSKSSLCIYPICSNILIDAFQSLAACLLVFTCNTSIKSIHDAWFESV